MQNLLENLKKVLEQDERFTVEGKLLKNKVVEAGLQLDPGLVKLLLKDEFLKNHFFQDVEGVLVFDKVKFQQFVSNKEFLPDSYTAFKNKIGLIADGEFLAENKEVVLSWAYKDCVLEGGQDKEDAKRDEVFWNEVLAPGDIDRLLHPKVFTNWKRHTQEGEEEVKDLSLEDNLVLKGNNLLALHSLKRVYRGKVKLIYIDPPYNTGSDSFRYNDTFNHSTWLTFMRNRLQVAKELLSRSGVICINVDDKEGFYLKVMCDEIFGRDNFLTNITVKTSDPSGHKTVNPAPYSQSEYVLMYAKSKKDYKYEIHYVASEYDAGYSKYVRNKEADFSEWEFENVNEVVSREHGYETTRDARKKLGTHVFDSLVSDFALTNKAKVFQLTAISDDAGKEIVSIRDESKSKDGVVFKIAREKGEDIYVFEGRQMYFYSSKVKIIDGVETPAKPLTNIWTDIPYNGIANEGNVKLKNGKKPEKLIRRLIDICTKPGDLVLDFHLGSGTTCAVAHKMGRKYIGVEQLDYENNDCVERLKNVLQGESTGISKAVKWSGGGSFVYAELKKANQAWIDEVMGAEDDEVLNDLWSRMQQHAFISYKVEPKSISETAKDFESLHIEDKKRFLVEVLDKNALYVNLSDIENQDFQVSEKDKALTKLFYSLK